MWCAIEANPVMGVDCIAAIAIIPGGYDYSRGNDKGVGCGRDD